MPIRYCSLTYFDDPGEVLPVHIVICLEEHLPQPALTDGIVLGVELVETMEGVTVLGDQRKVSKRILSNKKVFV